MIRTRPIPAPAAFTGDGRLLWQEVQRHLRRQGTWQDADCPLLESYCRAVMLARTARATASVEPFITGSRGQPVPHPGIKMARDAEADARAAAAALLLTPEARKRHDLAPARSVDDDFAALLA